MDSPQNKDGDLLADPALKKKWYTGGSIYIRGLENPEVIAEWKEMRHPEFYKKDRSTTVTASASPHKGPQTIIDGTNLSASATTVIDVTKTMPEKIGNKQLQLLNNRLLAQNEALTLRVTQLLSVIRKGNLKLHTCGQCGMEFAHRNQKSVHVNYVHRGIRWRCEYCSKEFKAPSSKKVHMTKCPNMKLKTVKCSQT